MLYVAGEIFLWMALAFLLGLLIGYLIWGWLARRRRREEEAQAERERQRAAALGADASVATDRPKAMAMRGPSTDKTATLVAEAPESVAPGFATHVPDVEAVTSGLVASAVDSPVVSAAAPEELEPVVSAAAPVVSEPVIDVAAGAAILGHPVVVDDLKLVEGIGPKIEQVLHGADIRTWTALSTTEVPHLRTVLDEAGPQFRIADPGTWPEQATLALGNRWADLKDLQDHLRAGRA
jgi:predicted flap endonuclease-1-like 5' DNA nuclease